MTTGKMIVSGAAALIVGAALLGLSFASPQGASAGNIVPCDATATATATEPVGDIAANAVEPTDTPIPTCTPVKLKTHTPTNTATAAATQTPVPVTPAPTQPAATATKPGGGSEGQGVRPPNTGSGPAGRGAVDLRLLMAGIAMAALGGSSLLAAARKRR